MRGRRESCYGIVVFTHHSENREERRKGEKINRRHKIDISSRNGIKRKIRQEWNGRKKKIRKKNQLFYWKKVIENWEGKNHECGKIEPKDDNQLSWEG